MTTAEYRTAGPVAREAGAAAPDAAREALRRSRTLLEPGLRGAVGAIPGPLARIASYHFGWTDAAGRPDAGLTGKALRPALVFGSAEAVGCAAEHALAPAVAVELVHNFTLLHDDILDGDTTRRHRPTAWAVFGSPSALLTGDALLAHAPRVLAEDTAGPPATAAAGIRCLMEATAVVMEGELCDIAFEDRDSVSLAESVEMAERKTAALLASSCALGALWGGADAARTEALRRFGHHLGLAFQLTDDLLGIWGDPEATGKAAGADLACRKKSLPVVAALTSDTAAGRRLAALYGTPPEHDPRDEAAGGLGDSPDLLATMARLVEEAGGRAWAERAAEEQLGRALTALAAAAPRPAAARDLAALARLACSRDG